LLFHFYISCIEQGNHQLLSDSSDSGGLSDFDQSEVGVAVFLSL